MPDSIYSGMSQGTPLAAWKDGPLRRTVWQTRAAVILGTLTMLCAFLGLAYNALSLSTMSGEASDELSRRFNLAHFDAAFYAMSGICIAFYLTLLWGGYRLVRHQLPVSALLIRVWLLEIAYYVVVLLLCWIPGVGMNVGAAMGVANGGLMVQFVILLPIWGPLMIWWLRRGQPPSNEPSAAPLA